jgi:carboxyl-terminal processing protease
VAGRSSSSSRARRCRRSPCWNSAQRRRSDALPPHGRIARAASGRQRSRRRGRLIPRLRARLAGAICGAAALFGCTALPERVLVDPGPPGRPANAAALSERGLSRPLASAQKRAELADAVLGLIRDRYYDPALNGVDWTAVMRRARTRIEAAASDAEVYRELKAAAGELGDSHTAVLTPVEADRLRRGAAFGIGATLSVVDDRVAVSDVEADSPAQRAGLLPGDVIERIDGRPLDADTALDAGRSIDPPPLRPRAPGAQPAAGARRLRAALGMLQAHDGAAVDPVRLLIARRASGSTAEAALAGVELAGVELDLALTPRERVTAARVELRHYGTGLVVLRIDRFQATLLDELERALDQCAAASAIVIDLRGNPGGSFDVYRSVAARLLPDERLVMRAISRYEPGAVSQRITPIRIGPRAGDVPLRQPLAVLVDARTASAAELLALTLAEQRGAPLVGEPTCGCGVAVRRESILPLDGALRISETAFVSARGTRIEGAPLTPDVAARPTLDDLRAGRDPALAEALRQAAFRAARTGLQPGVQPRDHGAD